MTPEELLRLRLIQLLRHSVWGRMFESSIHEDKADEVVREAYEILKEKK